MEAITDNTQDIRNGWMRIDKKLFGNESYRDLSDPEVMEYVCKEWEFYFKQGKYASLTHARNTAKVKYEDFLIMVEKAKARDKNAK